MTQYAIVRFLDDNSPCWLDFSREYLDNAATYKAAVTLRCSERPTIKSFTAFVGNPRLTEITQKTASGWNIEESKRLCNNSRVSRLMVMHGVFEYAIDMGYLTINPFRHIQVPKATPAGRVLTDQEIRLFLQALPERPRRACKFALHTGMRIGEVCGLQWNEVMRSHLIVPAHKSKSGRDRWVLLSQGARQALGRRGVGPVFGISKGQLQKIITKTWKALGLGRIRFHDLRHTLSDRYMEHSDDPFGMMPGFGWASAQAMATYQNLSLRRQRPLLKVRYRT